MSLICKNNKSKEKIVCATRHTKWTCDMQLSGDMQYFGGYMGILTLSQTLLESKGQIWNS